MKEKLFSFCFRNIVKTSGETKTFDKSINQIEGKKFLFRYNFVQHTKV